MTTGSIIFGATPSDALVTPYSLSMRARDGKTAAAEMRIEIPSGKSRRIVTVDLDESDLMRLLIATASAIELLRKENRA